MMLQKVYTLAFVVMSVLSADGDAPVLTIFRGSLNLYNLRQRPDSNSTRE